MKLGPSWSTFKPSALAGPSPRSTSSPTTPCPGMTLRVQTANHYDLVLDQTIEDPIGEAAQEKSPSVPVDDRCRQWMGSDHLKARLNRYQEVFSEPGALVLIPPIRAFDICGRRRSKDRWLQRRARICLRTSSQGTPSSPPSLMSRSRSLSRRSSSARCSGVTGTSAGVRAKLSHSRSRRSRRSSGLRPSILIAVSLTTLFSRLLSFRAMMANSRHHLRSAH